MDVKIESLSQLNAQMHWREAETFLAEAVIDGQPERYLRNVQGFVFSGLHTLWRISEDNRSVAYAVTQIYTIDGISKTAQLYLATGEALDYFLQNMDMFHYWARKHDVSVLEIIGRKGWERVLRPYGFNFNHVSVSKRIDQELH